MDKIISEDALRRAITCLSDTGGQSWLRSLSVHLQSVTFALSFGTKWMVKMFDFKGDAVFPTLR